MIKISAAFTIILLLSGCRTLVPPENEDSSQPWAQPEGWQNTQGIPGFSGTYDDRGY